MLEGVGVDGPLRADAGLESVDDEAADEQGTDLVAMPEVETDPPGALGGADGDVADGALVARIELHADGSAVAGTDLEGEVAHGVAEALGGALPVQIIALGWPPSVNPPVPSGRRRVVSDSPGALEDGPLLRVAAAVARGPAQGVADHEDAGGR